MPIPDEVRQKAMDAVSHYSTTAQIRAYRDSGVAVSPEWQFTQAEPPKPETRPIPDHIRQQAMDAVSHPETQLRIRLVRDNGEIVTPTTPNRQSLQIAEKISRERIEARDVDRAHTEVTRDGFGREYG